MSRVVAFGRMVLVAALAALWPAARLTAQSSGVAI
jgi:hypothetical protein